MIFTMPPAKLEGLTVQFLPLADELEALAVKFS